jgi:DNA-binding transcriptional LysR family regulator
MSRSAGQWDTRIGRRIRLRDLHVFLTVVQSSSMAKAARHLAVTQPAVSKAIADLEHTLGVRLLDRGPHGVEPTLYGSALVRRGLAVFDELRQGVGEIEFMADPAVGEVRIGCPETIVAMLLPEVIERFSDEYPGVVLHVAQMNPVTLEIRELRDRSVDLMIGRMAVPFEEDDVNAEILFEEPLIVVAGAQSQWSRRRKIKLADLLDEKWILYPPNQVVSLLIEQAFRAQGLAPPRARVLTFSLQLRDMLLMAGDYLSVIPYSMVRAFNAKRLTVTPLAIKLGIQTRPVAMFTLKNRTLSPVAELFMECVRTTVKSMQSQHKY